MATTSVNQYTAIEVPMASITADDSLITDVQATNALVEVMKGMTNRYAQNRIYDGIHDHRYNIGVLDIPSALIPLAQRHCSSVQRKGYGMNLKLIQHLSWRR